MILDINYLLFLFVLIEFVLVLIEFLLVLMAFLLELIEFLMELMEFLLEFSLLATSTPILFVSPFRAESSEKK